MSTPRQHRQALRFIELGIAVAVLGVLIAVAAHRLLDLQARIEAHAVRADINAMHTAVTLTWLREPARVESGMNPEILLQRPGDGEPEGLVPSADADTLAAPGAWRFDPDAGALLYQPARRGAFPELEAASTSMIRVRVELEPQGPRLRVSPPLQD